MLTSSKYTISLNSHRKERETKREREDFGEGGT
jgi:hypothetical protein